MTKSQLIDLVAQRTGVAKSRAEIAVNCIFESMTAALERDEGIEIRGFGSFTVRHYKGYNGRNPRTGDSVDVPEKRLPFFKVGKELKALVNGEVPPEGHSGEAAEEHQTAAHSSFASSPVNDLEGAQHIQKLDTLS